MNGWLHEIKYDGFRMHARIDGRQVKLLTRTGLDWSHRYQRTIEALGALKVKSAYLDGELCALNADGVPVFGWLQAAMDEGRTDHFKASDDVKNLSQIWAVAPALVKLALRDDRRSQIDKEPPWKRIAKGLI